MNVTQFVQSVVGYFVKYVLPHVPEEKRFWLNIGARLKIEGKMAEIIPMLKDARVIDENGNVDIDKLQKFAEEAFKDTPRAFVDKFEFASSDLPQFINYLKTGV